MKKTLFISLLLIISLTASMVYLFRDYSILYGCIILTQGFDKPSQLDLIKSSFDSRTAEKCADPFIIDLSKLSKAGANENFSIREINGIKLFTGVIVPEKKDDDSIVDKDDQAVPLKQEVEVIPVQKQVTENSKDCDIAVYFIKSGVLEDFSGDEIEDAAVNIQSAAKKVNLIVTSNAEVSKDKIIRSSTGLVDISDQKKSVIVTFSVIMQDDGQKLVTLNPEEVSPVLSGQF